MNDFGTLLTENPNLFIGVFVGVLALFLVVFIIIKAVDGAKKKKLKLQMAELVFDAAVRPASKFVTDLQFSGYKIYSVNNKEPVVVGKSVFAPEGSCVVELEYIDTDYATSHRSMTTLHGRQTLELTVRLGAQCKISFDDQSRTFKVMEK
ncbi:MAG: hypothetical protein LBR10_13485 [Prevotellaceae bacterium]|jgi:hypothetical protein|nr:hypothetical protein [Prevotellaceae bacterium]